MIVIEPPKDDLEKLKNEFTIKDVPSNGSCLFDAVLESLSINGLAMGYKLRQVVCDALLNGIVDNATFSSQLQSMNLDKKQYIERMRERSSWGTEIEIAAMNKLFGI